MQKIISLFLALFVVVSLGLGALPVRAEQGSAPESGLCEHHPAHTRDCGYAPGQEGRPCTHTHDETCGGATPESACTHLHDEACGYREATPRTPCTYAQNGCPWCVKEWQWESDNASWRQTEEGWLLTLPAAAQPLTEEGLAALLPARIDAVTGSGESVKLDLVWDLAGFGTGDTVAQSYTVSARPADERYALAEGAAPLQITVEPDEAAGEAEKEETEEELEAEVMQPPSAMAYIARESVPFPEHLVDGVSPNGTVINLFDYWITAKTETYYGDNTATTFLSQGINNGHALIFGKSLDKNPNAIGEWNKWTRSEKPYTGIVKNTLGVDGYPKLNVPIGTAGALTTKDGTQSLAYLFDPGVSCNGKDSYRDVRGLLQVDDQGYYYYDSGKNYAVFAEDSNSFALYNYPGVLPGGNSPVGQFFPFNAATANAATVTYGGKTYTLMNTVDSNSNTLNHYFGMHMSTRFIQQDNGYIQTDAGSIPVTYTFSGDDDIWIFIDDVLVADLGGIHNKASVEIDFSTGVITINGTDQEMTLGEILGGEAGTLPDNTYHTLDFFYLERGNVDSNMSLKYNLVTIPESSLIKVDQMGDPVPGTEFALYAADAYEANGENATPIAIGRTDLNGEFVFLDKDHFPITIQKLYNTYRDHRDSSGNNLILCETYTPSGYRAGSPIGLYFQTVQDGGVLLLSNSVWDEGAYAMPKVTTTTPRVIRSMEDTNKTVVLVGADAVENPLIFAVIFQKVKNDDGSFATDGQGNYLWRPVSGDPMVGWKVEADSSWDSVLAAAKATPYVFRLASSGAYQVEIDNLPGDIRTYYHVCKDLDTAGYTIGYYYSDADTLDAATEANTWRIDSDPPPGEERYALNRVFSMDLYVSNMKNQLSVQKVDETGTPVDGAEFSLYRAQYVNRNTDGTITIPEGVTPYDRLTTGATAGVLTLEGGGRFPAQRSLLENGEYYLVETDAPGGYQANETAVHIIIDDTGVYADAGTDEDGVTVLRGVGSVMRSMLQFAAEDDVDTTLQSIQAALATNVQYNGTGFTWQDADWSNTGRVLHLQFANANRMLDYGLYDPTVPATVDNLTLATEAGWSRLLIRQCYQHDGSVNTAIKENLGDRDITGLFSGTVTVRVENHRTGNLKISKAVTGTGAPAGATFGFSLYFTYNGAPLTGTYQTVDQNGTQRTIRVDNGSATLPLQAAQSCTVLGLPTGTVYTVTENTPPAGFGVTAAVTGDTSAAVTGATVQGAIPHHQKEEDAVTLAYTNDFDGQTRARLTGVKTLQGRSIGVGETFLFVLEPRDETTRQAVEEGAVLLPDGTAAAVGNGTATAEFVFEDIAFLQEGSYSFQIREVLPADITGSLPVSGGIWYDTHTATATVTVTRDSASGLLAASVRYDNTGAFSPADAAETAGAAFTNAAAALTLTKTVSGNLGDRDQEFQFHITLRDDGSAALTGSFPYTKTTAQGTVSDRLTPGADGTANVYLAHGQSITVYGLPPGGSYTITEPGAQQAGYTVRYTIGGTPIQEETVRGTLDGSNTPLVCENSRQSVVPTGVTLEQRPWLLAGAFSLAGGAALVWGERRKHRRRNADKEVADHKD